MKFTLNKPPLKAIAWIQHILTSYIELATQQWRKSVLVSLMAPFVRPRSKNHTLAPIHLFTKQIAPSMYQELIGLKSFVIHDTSFQHAPYKFFPSIKNILGVSYFFLYFHHSFRGLAGAFKLSFCVFTYLLNNSLIS